MSFLSIIILYEEKFIFSRVFLIIFLIFPILTEKNKIQNRRNLESLSEISVKIKGKNNQRIISSYFYNQAPEPYRPYPDIYLNDTLLCERCYAVYLEEDYTILKLKFNSEISYFSNLFDGLKNLIEANFTNFYSTNRKLMDKMFFECSYLEYVNISKFNNNLFTAGSLFQVFLGCQSLISLDISSFDTTECTNMAELFYSCKNLISLDISNFNTEKINSMSKMFLGCRQLTSLNLSNFKTELVTNMENMFASCESLTSIDLYNFKTENVKTMKSMFYGCIKLKSLDLSNFETPSLEEFKSMFSNCYSLTSLNISNFNTSNIKDMSQLFSNCYSLTSLDLSIFDPSSAEKMNQMFERL